MLRGAFSASSTPPPRMLEALCLEVKRADIGQKCATKVLVNRNEANVRMPRTTDLPISLHAVFDLLFVSSKGLFEMPTRALADGSGCRIDALRRECSGYRRAMDRRQTSAQLRPLSMKSRALNCSKPSPCPRRS
jgi:hypothetical protein